MTIYLYHTCVLRGVKPGSSLQGFQDLLWRCLKKERNYCALISDGTYKHYVKLYSSRLNSVDSKTSTHNYIQASGA